MLNQKFVCPEDVCVVCFTGSVRWSINAPPAILSLIENIMCSGKMQEKVLQTSTQLWFGSAALRRQMFNKYSAQSTLLHLMGSNYIVTLTMLYHIMDNIEHYFIIKVWDKLTPVLIFMNHSQFVAAARNSVTE